jgi:hypothetical protein
MDMEALKKCGEISSTKNKPDEFFGGFDLRKYTFKQLEMMKKGGYAPRNDNNNNNRGGRGRGRGSYPNRDNNDFQKGGSIPDKILSPEEEMMVRPQIDAQREKLRLESQATLKRIKQDKNLY